MYTCNRGIRLIVIKSKIKGNYIIDVRQGNDMDLLCYKDETFDVTLVLRKWFISVEYNCVKSQCPYIMP